jgi:hypothetical protein
LPAARICRAMTSLKVCSQIPIYLHVTAFKIKLEGLLILRTMDTKMKTF